jgi:hydrogenase maturation protein HypF
VRRRLTVTGQVQGVGFRPFVYRLALTHALTGSVKNTPEGVVIDLQGPDASVAAFARDLTERLPPLARIVTLDAKDLAPLPGEAAFSIEKSTAGHGHTVLVSPDVATCPDCLADLFDPSNRRYLYPFTNCTNCGPRYTITRHIPYDRAATSMACFPLCAPCAAEYDDPLDRRFHAQPNACPACGPAVWLTDASGARLSDGPEALSRLARELTEGRICAVKGLGGFHLAVDAANETAVEELRRRKNRKGKPLAVMVPDLNTARAVCQVSPAEAEMLAGRQRPIVLLAKAPGAAALAPGLSPDTEFLGLMLPYTPLHHVLLHHFRELTRLPALVMTSGNASSEPIALGNREALHRLAGIADRFLFHNRDILIRTDDSVLRLVPDLHGDGRPAPQFFRRARGFTPSPVFLAEPGPTVLGVGPELKNTLCLTKGDQAFVSQHIGDMENLETFGFHQEIAAHLAAILQVTPKLCVRDLHPDYLSSRHAESLDLPVVSLQHHFAHIHAALAEHKHLAPAIGLALDGTGLGDDGTLWGGEGLYVEPRTLAHRRLAHFSPIRLPGGEAAIREPWRIAQSFLHALGRRIPGARPWPWLPAFAPAVPIVAAMLDKGLNSPVSTSCGRLFDAVSALAGACLTTSYEGQAAIILEAIQDLSETTAYPCPVQTTATPYILDTLTLFAHVAEDLDRGTAPAVVSRRFHLGLIAGLADLAAILAETSGTTTVAISGGVMQNLTLTTLLPQALRARGLTPLLHRELPPNDACISLGQAAYGQRLLLRG